MRIPISPILVVTSLLIASHLGLPGGARSETLPTSPLEQPGIAWGGFEEEDDGWRVERTAALAGDLDSVSLPLDPFSVPLEQSGPGDGSAPSSGPAPPPAPPYAAAVAVPNQAPPAPTKPAVQQYEVEDKNHHVRQFLDRFQTGDRRAVVERWLIRSGHYLPMILDVFRQKGLPEELVFTAMIESGFNPVAVSRAGAKGLWQFMAPTAKRYGLRVDQWLDERLDPEKSTIAAARHLLDLYAVFGSWNLVQAAYNAGEMKVLQAIRAMGTSDFWTLRSGPVLKEETKNFVPAIQAATLIAREPARYGFVVTPAEPLQYEVVTVPKATSLKRLAAVSGVPLDALERLNTELRLGQTPPDGPYALKVPVGSAKPVEAAVEKERAALRAAVPRTDPPGRGKVPPAVHVVKVRETVSAIAKKYGVSVADLRRWNELDETARIRPGDRIRVAAVSRRDEGQGGFR